MLNGTGLLLAAAVVALGTGAANAEPMLFWPHVVF
jgi:hypothetical protein